MDADALVSASPTSDALTQLQYFSSGDIAILMELIERYIRQDSRKRPSNSDDDYRHLANMDSDMAKQLISYLMDVKIDTFCECVVPKYKNMHIALRYLEMFAVFAYSAMFPMEPEYQTVLDKWRSLVFDSALRTEFHFISHAPIEKCPNTLKTLLANLYATYIHTYNLANLKSNVDLTQQLSSSAMSILVKTKHIIYQKLTHNLRHIYAATQVNRTFYEDDTSMCTTTLFNRIYCKNIWYRLVRHSRFEVSFVRFNLADNHNMVLIQPNSNLDGWSLFKFINEAMNISIDVPSEDIFQNDYSKYEGYVEMPSVQNEFHFVAPMMDSIMALNTTVNFEQSIFSAQIRKKEFKNCLQIIGNQQRALFDNKLPQTFRNDAYATAVFVYDRPFFRLIYNLKNLVGIQWVTKACLKCKTPRTSQTPDVKYPRTPELDIADATTKMHNPN